MLILCSGINSANYDETLLLSILSKFKLESLVVHDGDWDETIFMLLLRMPSIKETLEHLSIYRLDISKCTSVIELLLEFKRIKSIRIYWHYNTNDDVDEIEEWKLKIEQFEEKLKNKHSEIEIDSQER